MGYVASTTAEDSSSRVFTHREIMVSSSVWMLLSSSWIQPISTTSSSSLFLWYFVMHCSFMRHRHVLIQVPTIPVFSSIILPIPSSNWRACMLQLQGSGHPTTFVLASPFKIFSLDFVTNSDDKSPPSWWSHIWQLEFLQKNFFSIILQYLRVNLITFLEKNIEFNSFEPPQG